MKIKNKLAVLMAAMMVTSSAVSIQAATTDTQKAELPVLDLSLAINSATHTDGNIEVYKKEKKAADEYVKNAADISSTRYFANLIYKQKYAQDISYREDALTYKVTTLYNEMALLQKQVAFVDKKIALEEKKFKESEVKYQNNMLSKADFDTAKSNLESVKKSKVDMQAQFEEDRVKFNTLAKFDVNYYTLEGNFEAEEYTFNGNLQRHFNESVEQMQKYDREIAEMTDRNVIFDTSGDRGEFEPISYYSSKASAASTLNQLDSAKKTSVEQLNSTYTSMVTTWKKIGDLEDNIKDMNRKLAALKIKLEKGYASQMEVDQVEMNIEEAQMNIIECKVKYNAMVDAIKKPWVMFN